MSASLSLSHNVTYQNDLKKIHPDPRVPFLARSFLEVVIAKVQHFANAASHQLVHHLLQDATWPLQEGKQT
jgi:hypothetical protein